MQRPFVHPSVDDIYLEGVLYALADATRLAIVRKLMSVAQPVNCSMASPKGSPKSTLSHHYKVLRESGVIRSEKRGTEIFNSVRYDEIEKKFPGVLQAILDAAAKTHAVS